MLGKIADKQQVFSERILPTRTVRLGEIKEACPSSHGCNMKKTGFRGGSLTSEASNTWVGNLWPVDQIQPAAYFCTVGEPKNGLYIFKRL